MKIIKFILSYLIDLLLNRFQYYIVAFLIYTFISNIETIFPKLTFWNFLWIILAAEVYVLKSTKIGVQLLYKTPKAKPTKFFKSELEEIKQQHKVFLKQYKIKEEEVN